MRFVSSILVSVVLSVILLTPAVAQKRFANGDRVVRRNRLISAQSEPGRQLHQPKKRFDKKTITADAEMSEADWRNAQTISQFVDSTGRKEETIVKVLFDQNNIYLFWVVHEEGAITADVKEKDTIITGDDYVQINLKPWLPDDIKYARDYYYSIAVNPIGTVWDSYFDPYLGGYFFSSWDSNIQVATSQEGDKWLAEMIIPFSGLDHSSDPGWKWNLDFWHISQIEGENKKLYTPQAGITVEQGIMVRRKGLVDYYWIRPEFMQEVKPKKRSEQSNSVRAIAIDKVPATNGKPDADLWSKAETIKIKHNDRTGQLLGANTARVKVAATTDHLCFSLEADGSKIELASDVEEATGRSMGRQMKGVNGVYVDTALFANECFWMILQPRRTDADNIHNAHYLIKISSNGHIDSTKYDQFGAPDRSWRPKAQVDIYNTTTGWGAEVNVAMSSFDLPAGCTKTWGFNIFRNRMLGKESKQKSELQAWLVTGTDFLNPDTFGTLTDVILNNTRRPLEHVDNMPGIIDAKKHYDAFAHPAKGGYPLFDVQFIGNKGWAVGAMGTILRSEDGGKTWQSVDIATDADLYRVFFVNEMEGWAAGGRIRMAPTNDQMRHDERGGYGYIFHTTNGGKTWECQYGERGRHLFGLYFTDENTGYACGERGILLKTEDGGVHWKEYPTTGTRRWLYGITFKDKLNGFAVGESEIVLRTTDGGKSWVKLNAPADRQFYGFRTFYRDVTFNGSTGCIVGQFGCILISSDGGQTWRSAATFFDTKIRELLDLNSVQFVTDKLGFAVGELGTRLMVTEDGGKSWSLRPVANRDWLRALWADADGKIVLVGEREKVLISNDKGFNWNTVRGDKPKADILVIMAHGDDSPIVLGPTLVYYGINEGRQIVDVGVMCDCHSSEYEETYNLEHDRSIWMFGARTSTNFNEFETGNNGCDYYHFTERLWEGEDNVIRHMVAAIRAYRPDIVITHGGVFGDYDKPGHKVSGRAGLPAFETSGGQVDHWPQLTRLGLEPWQPKKLYCRASESYPATFDLTAIGEIALKGTNQTCWEWAEYVIRNFQSQGIHHARNSQLCLIKSMVPVPEKESSIFDGL